MYYTGPMIYMIYHNFNSNLTSKKSIGLLKNLKGGAEWLHECRENRRYVILSTCRYAKCQKNYLTLALQSLTNSLLLCRLSTFFL